MSQAGSVDARDPITKAWAMHNGLDLGGVYKTAGLPQRRREQWYSLGGEPIMARLSM